MDKVRFYFDDFDITDMTYRSIEQLITKIEQTQHISRVEATNNLVISQLFKRMMNPNEMLWARSTDFLYEQYEMSINSIYLLQNKNITKQVNDKIIHIVQKIANIEGVTKVEAAAILFSSDYYNMTNQTDLILYSDDFILSNLYTRNKIH